MLSKMFPFLEVKPLFSGFCNQGYLFRVRVLSLSLRVKISFKNHKIDLVVTALIVEKLVVVSLK